MYSSAEMTLLIATEYQRERIADAERYRVLTQARRARRGRRGRQDRQDRQDHRRRVEMSACAGSLAPCAPAAV